MTGGLTTLKDVPVHLVSSFATNIEISSRAKFIYKNENGRG